MKLTKDQIIDTMLEFCNEKQDFIDGKEVDMYSFSPEAFDAGATNLIAQQDDESHSPSDREIELEKEVERLKGLVKSQFFKYYDDDFQNDIWQTFKTENNL